jgi:hypothetical protein
MTCFVFPNTKAFPKRGRQSERGRHSRSQNFTSVQGAAVHMRARQAEERGNVGGTRKTTLIGGFIE